MLNTEHDSLRVIVYKTLNERMNEWAAAAAAAAAANCYQLFPMHTPKNSGPATAAAVQPSKTMTATLDDTQIQKGKKQQQRRTNGNRVCEHLFREQA